MTRLILPIFIFIALSPTALAENWPNWRGPNFDGVSGERNIPTEWGENKNVLWALPMPGVGCSTPAVWGDRMYFTCEDSGNVVLMCVSTDGKQLWKRTVGSFGKESRNPEVKSATASSTTDGKYVWSFAGGGELSCVSVDGNPVWSVNLQEYGKFRSNFGQHTSPLHFGNRVYVQLLHKNAQLLLAYDDATGKLAWKIDRHGEGDPNTESPDGYASVQIWKKGGDSFLVVHGNDATTGHRLEDGSEIWRVVDENPRGSGAWRFISSPAVAEDLIVIPTCKNGPTVAVRPDIKGKVGAHGDGELWRLNVTSDVPSPLIHDGLVYLCRGEGQILCIEGKTGKVLYEERGYNSRHRASPVYADGKVYLTARDGTVSVIEAGPTYKLLSRNKLPDDFAGSPAISNGRIYLHGFNTLYAIGTK